MCVIPGRFCTCCPALRGLLSPGAGPCCSTARLRRRHTAAPWSATAAWRRGPSAGRIRPWQRRPPPRCRRPGQYRSAVADVDSVSCIFYVIFSGGKRSKDIKQPDVRRVKDPALHPVSFIIPEAGVILWFFDRLRKAPALLAPEPSLSLTSQVQRKF